MNEIITILCPQAKPAEQGFLWAKFKVNGIEGCEWLYFCANGQIASERLVNQIKPLIKEGQGYFAIFPVSDSVEIGGSSTNTATSFAVVHFGCYPDYGSQAIARTHVSELLALFRETQNRYISGIRINSSSFNKWSDDNSTLQQYTAMVTVKSVTPYALAPNCNIE